MSDYLRIADQFRVAFAAIQTRADGRWNVLYLRDGQLHTKDGLEPRQARAIVRRTLDYMHEVKLATKTAPARPVLSEKPLRNPRPPIPLDVRFSVLQRDGFRCRYCGAAAPDAILHVDHVVPYSKGGTLDMENLVAACRDCNLGKQARLL